jgi:hypothetical protein
MSAALVFVNLRTIPFLIFLERSTTFQKYHAWSLAWLRVALEEALNP